MASLIEALPMEILHNIFLYLSGCMLGRCTSVNKLFRDILSDPWIWKPKCPADIISRAPPTVYVYIVSNY